MIHFNVPPYVGKEIEYIKDAIERHKICGDGYYTKKCNEWIENAFNCKKVLLTTSGTSALEMAAILCDIQPGDEVILPSYTFSSTANAFVLRGAKLVFVDIRSDTMNIDENLIEKAITGRTKAICVVHYAGVACEMTKVMAIAKKYGLFVIEDAAQAIFSTYNNIPLGTIGDFGCFSFHETKNLSMGEGGALLINNSKYIEEAEIIREKGTNRSQFFRGQVAKYNWIEKGSSFLPSDLNAAYLYAQLEFSREIQKSRFEIWNRYYNELKCLLDEKIIEFQVQQDNCSHNAHMFYIKCKDLEIRTKFIDFMKDAGVLCVFHYVPLHTAPAGMKYGRFEGIDRNTTSESDRLVRLPLYYKMSKEDLDYVIKMVKEFFENEVVK